jgi:SAM-dependent methyltransferase
MNIAKRVQKIKNNFEYRYRDYDKLIPKLVPGYFELKNAIYNSVKELGLEEARFLDLGCGTAILGEELLNLNPNYSYCGIDISEHMIEEAKRRLRRFGKRARLITGDLSKVNKIEFSESDIIISVLAIHHFENKIPIYRLIYNLCAPHKSTFILGDLVVDPSKDKKIFEIRKKHMENCGMTEKEIEEWFQNWDEEDKPSTIEENVTMLKKVGFLPKLIWQNHSYAAFVCKVR